MNMETYMKSIYQSCRESNIPPAYLQIGNAIEELYPMWTSFLHRQTLELVHEPEPCIWYFMTFLQEALDMNIAFARSRDESQGIHYVAPINRIFEYGFEADLGPNRLIMLPLRLWDVIHDDGRIIMAELPQAGEH